jgi:hypothetical protein
LSFINPPKNKKNPNQLRGLKRVFPLLDQGGNQRS